jgi:hypothetical protein
LNYVNGKIADEEECQSILENIEGMILETLQKPPLDINLVIDACDTLVKNIGSLDIVRRLPDMGVSPLLAEIYLGQVGQMFSARAIRERLKTELGENFDRGTEIVYPYSKAKALQTIAPVGVLFHITAGNMDVLPFVSLVEGLLCGNINIVKLPREDGGVTVSLLEELINIQPSLKEYIYVFDYSSRDIYSMKKLAAAADAIVVWGGDEAVKAVRALADPNIKIIEWGHKISFAYSTTGGASDEALKKLALGICMTNQLFCSSCQGIFLDTCDMEDVYGFCRRFLPVLEQTSLESPFASDDGARLFTQARVSLELYHKEIESRAAGSRIFKGEDCSIIACTDSKLETSIMFRNIWVKPLKREKIINLRRYKNYLQTAALICNPGEHAELSQKLLSAGIVKVSDGFDMSNYACGEAHDGVFALRSYTKIVSVQG